MQKLVNSFIYQPRQLEELIEAKRIEMINIHIRLDLNKMTILYRLSPDRESRVTIDTSFEMGILTIELVRYSQYL